jgi:Cu/Ag efflux protein CusF
MARRRPRAIWSTLAALVVATALAGCSGSHQTSEPSDDSVAAAEGQTFVVEGRVTGTDPGQGLLLVEHDPIPEIMPHVMLMGFPASSPDLLRGLQRGQRVELTLQQQSGQLVLIGVAPAR